MLIHAHDTKGKIAKTNRPLTSKQNRKPKGSTKEQTDATKAKRLALLCDIV